MNLTTPAPGAAPAFDLECIRQRAGRLTPIEEDVLARGGEEKGDFQLNPDTAALLRTARPRDAAVLVPILPREPEATVLLTLRTEHLPSHAGQIAFPGGKIDPDDPGPAAACLREAEEEIGLPREQVELLGFGDLYVTGSGYRIVPVIGIVRGEPELNPNPQEVAEVFEVPLSFLMKAENHHRGRRLWEGRERRFYVMPYYRHYIWGVTAGIIRNLYERLYG